MLMPVHEPDSSRKVAPIHASWCVVVMHIVELAGQITVVNPQTEADQPRPKLDLQPGTVADSTREP